MATKGILSKGKQKEMKSAGLRMTGQRALILDIISQRPGHLAADEVYSLARQRQPGISLSTVYRNLQALKKLGLIKELHFDDSHHHYEVKPSIEHHHLVCQGCGKVIEFESPLIRKLVRKVQRDHRFNVIKAELYLEGYCEQCKEKTCQQ